MKKLPTQLILLVLKGISWLPFRVLYFFSDLTYPVIYYLVGYRKKIVFSNLKNSFPEKTSDEISTIARNYYKHLCDLFFESIKVKDMELKTFENRFIVTGTEKLNRYFNENRSLIILSTHYCNWEWNAIVKHYLKHKTFGVYKPLNNEIFNSYFKSIREKFGIIFIPMALTLRVILESEKKQERIITWLAADQTPPSNHKFWTCFFHQEAMFFNGPAKIARQFNQPVFFQYTRKLARGVYETGVELLFDNPAEVDEVTIIKTYVQKLESLIREKPEYYLWSHRRWKHKRPENLPLY